MSVYGYAVVRSSYVCCLMRDADDSKNYVNTAKNLADMHMRNADGLGSNAHVRTT